jgi:Periplasmic component of the Tol biopolymer transport system
MRAAFPVSVLLATLGAGCGGTLVWQGKTLDRLHWVQILEDGRGQRVKIGAAAGPRYDGIGIDALALSQQGNHVAYPARRGSAWLVVHDGRELGPWNGVGELAFSPDGARLAFSVERDGGWHVVVDGKAGPRFEAIFAHSLTWSPDGMALAYAASLAGHARAVLNQVPGPPLDGVGRLVFGGSHSTYVGRIGTLSFLVLDGAAGPPAEWIGEIAFSPSGAHVAYVAGAGDEERIVIDGREVEGSEKGHVSLLHVDDHGAPTFVVSSRGLARLVRHTEIGPAYAAISELVVTPAGRWAYLAREGESMRAILEGGQSPPCEWAGNLVASPDGKRFAYLARRQGRTVVVGEGRETPVDGVVDGSLVWSRDSRHWACVAGDPKTRAIFVSVDGIRRRPFDVREMVFLAERQSAQPPGSENHLLQEIVSGELELDLASSDGIRR